MGRPAPRFRLSWPFLLLVAGLVCIAAALFEAEVSISSTQAIARQAVRGYSSFAAWSFEEHFTESVRDDVQRALTGAA